MYPSSFAPGFQEGHHRLRERSVEEASLVMENRMCKELGLVMLQSQVLANAVTKAAGGTPNEEFFLRKQLEETVRIAKRKMQTVTVIEDALYIDYRFISRIPPGMIVKV